MGTKPKDKKALIQEYRTEGILEAARKVIALRGFDNATMGEVAEAAGISKATIYLYFKNKDELYFNCVIEKLDGVIEEMKDAVEGIDDPIERLRTVFEVQTKKAEEDQDFFRVFLTEKMTIFMNRSTRSGQEYYKRVSEYNDILIGALQDGMRMGLIRETDPLKAANMLFSMLRGMAMLKIIQGEELSLTGEVDYLLDMFLNGVSVRD